MPKFWDGDIHCSTRWQGSVLGTLFCIYAPDLPSRVKLSLPHILYGLLLNTEKCSYMVIATINQIESVHNMNPVIEDQQINESLI